MDFARKQLEKYGWAEGNSIFSNVISWFQITLTTKCVLGKGLGKKEDGISNALKPKLKFDNTGIGHDPAEEFTNDWWNNVYNSAINNIEVSILIDIINIVIAYHFYRCKRIMVIFQ